MERKGCESIGCYTHFVTFNIPVTHDLDLISISPDLPPVLRQLKKDILSQRKELDLNVRKMSRIQYIKQWPYLKLKINGQPDRYPKISQDTIVKEFLGVAPLLRVPEGL